MSIYSKHPTYAKFIDNELSTLNFIANYPAIATNFINLSSRANEKYTKYLGVKSKQRESLQFDFGANFEVEVEGRPGQVTIECILTPEFNLASYVLGVCRKKPKSLTILRKFHFDYAIPVTGQNQPKPVYHVQYGGVASPELRALKVNVESLHPKISSPRLTSLPTNLALLVDTAFSEFRTPVTDRIIKDDKWKEFIKHNEALLLAPYFEGYHKFIVSEHSSDFLMREFHYGR